MLNAPKSCGHEYAKDFLAPMMGDWVQGPGTLGLQMLKTIQTVASSLNWVILCPGTCRATCLFGVSGEP